jgi:hypothetical protein
LARQPGIVGGGSIQREDDGGSSLGTGDKSRRLVRARLSGKMTATAVPTNMSVRLSQERRVSRGRQPIRG